MRRILTFTAGSGAGLAADLILFSVLNAIGAPAVAANLASTSVAITITYSLVTRHSFGVTATWRQYGAFFAWYGISAIVVSTLIGVLGAGREEMNLVWKAAFVPVTFTTNFFFSRWLFAKTPGRAQSPFSRRRPPLDARPRNRILSSRTRQNLAVAAAHPWITSAIVTTLFFIFVMPLTRAISFPQPTEFGAVLRAHLTEWAFALAMVCLLRWGIRFGLGVLRREAHYCRWLAASVAHLLLLMPIFIAIYPGHWVFDEFDTVYGATHFFPIAWQGYLTHVYYAFCMYLLPSAVGIVVVQIVFISVVAGYVVTVLAARLRRPWLSGLVILALMSPAVLLNDFYPLRLTAYGFLLLLVVTHLLRRAHDGRVARPLEFFATSCAIAILAFWRTEGLMTLLLLPVAAVVLGLPGLARLAPMRAMSAVVAGLLVISFSGWLSRATGDPKYQFTAMINPLSTMLQIDLRGADVAADLRAVDAVIDVNALRSMPSYTETPAFFTAGLRPDAAAHSREFTRAYIDLVAHNPGAFLTNRLNTFIAANSMTSWAPQVQIGGINGSNPVQAAKFEAFENSTPLARSWNLDLKHQTARHLFLLDSTLKPTAWTAIVWNAIPSIAVVLSAFVIALVRRRWTLAACAGAVGGSAVLVFASEPASYFMYFFPVYVVGLVAAASFGATHLDRMLVRQPASVGLRTAAAAEAPAAR